MDDAKSESSLICKLCGLPFANRQNLSEHLRLHIENPYACKFCDFSDISKEIFEEHSKTHLLSLFQNKDDQKVHTKIKEENIDSKNVKNF